MNNIKLTSVRNRINQNNYHYKSNMLSYNLKLKFESLNSDSSSAGHSSSSLSSADLFLLEMSGTFSNVESLRPIWPFSSSAF